MRTDANKLAQQSLTMPLTQQAIRNLVREVVAQELRRHKRLTEEKPGLPVVFSCDCGRPEEKKQSCGELHVSPVVVGGERCVDLRVLGMGGCVLGKASREQLAEILYEKDWYGDRADLGQ